MTERKDDGGPFHPSGKGTDTTSMYGASFRAVAAMEFKAALIVRYGLQHEHIFDLDQVATAEADSLIVELKK